MSLTSEEWSKAISELLDSDPHNHEVFEMQNKPAGPVLCLRRRLKYMPLSYTEDEFDDQDAAEVDSEEIVAQPSQVLLNRGLSVEYSIGYSVSYQVPVLSLSVHNEHKKVQLPLNDLYDVLVPETSRSQFAGDSPLGMLTMVDMQDGWGYQVHPCRTQEVMQGLLGGQRRSPLRYMMLWIGTVGPAVGLVMPRELQLKHQRSLEAELNAIQQL